MAMFGAERVFNLLLGASVLSWAFLGMFRGDLSHSNAPMRLSIGALHLCVALLVFRRSPLRKGASMVAVAACLPALFISTWAMKIAGDDVDWPWPVQSLFAAGAGLAILTFLTMGRNFAILPAVRALVTHGPFRMVRHPAYLGELMMIAGCILVAPSVYGAMLTLAAPLVVALRIVQEEKLLDAVAGYQEYKTAVRWRLLPGIW